MNEIEQPIDLRKPRGKPDGNSGRPAESRDHQRVEGPREPGKTFNRKTDCENPDLSQNDPKGFSGSG